MARVVFIKKVCFIPVFTAVILLGKGVPMTNNSLSIIFSNLSKAGEKQQDPISAEAYSKLADQYLETASGKDDFCVLKEHIAASLTEEYPSLQKQAEEVGDRGVLRALKWGQKVTTLQKSLIDRFLSKGESLMDGKDLYVCEACGFIFLGAGVPDICPVCKAPASRFSKVK